jgi:D-serine deaminase-like pyridoxal phosphate-dependent protein
MEEVEELRARVGVKDREFRVLLEREASAGRGGLTKNRTALAKRLRAVARRLRPQRGGC